MVWSDRISFFLKRANTSVIKIFPFVHSQDTSVATSAKGNVNLLSFTDQLREQCNNVFIWYAQGNSGCYFQLSNSVLLGDEELIDLEKLACLIPYSLDAVFICAFTAFLPYTQSQIISLYCTECSTLLTHPTKPLHTSCLNTG